MASLNSQTLDTALIQSASEFSMPMVSMVLDTPSDEFKEYVVIVKEGFTIDSLDADLERDTSEDDGVDSSIIPDRPVNVANRRPGSDRQTHYFLTYAEAQALKNHSMVLDVELLPDINPALTITPSAVSNKDFTKQALFGSEPGDTANYGLFRCSSATNNYGTGSGGRGDYEFIADGSSIDIVIMDTGIKADHPEFNDDNGVSRVQQIDWYATVGGAYTGTSMPAGFYTDTSGHGTHVAGIAAGRTFGWAKNAKIYVMNNMGDAGQTISALEGFDLIKQFHINKPIDPALGFKRPTVVNMSWGVSAYLMSSASPYDPYAGHSIYTGYQIWGGSYRGTSWSGYTLHTEYGMKGLNVGTYANGSATASVLYQIPGYSTSYDAACADLIAAGIHLVHASGNEGAKFDVSGGVDYNNYVNIVSAVVSGAPVLTPIYYNRPSSPWAAGTLNVGSVEITPYSSTLEQRASYSCYGTGVDIYAPGGGIVSAFHSAGTAYPENSSYYQKNDSGTSMSSPQVAGMLALFLQQNPGATPAVGKKWLTTTTKGCIDSVMYDTGLTNDYTNGASLGGGPNKFLHNPYSAPSFTMGQSGITLSHMSMQMV